MSKKRHTIPNEKVVPAKVAPTIATPKTLHYAILCEDIAQRTFISETLKRVNAIEDFRNVQLIWDNTFPVLAKDKNGVERQCENAAKLSLVRNNDFLIVVRDTDTTDKKGCEAIRNTFKKKQLTVKSALVLAFPVQFIEHWLLYCIHFAKNPTSTKNPTFETIPPYEAKMQCYTKPKTREYERELKVRELTQQHDVKKLHDKSDSFKEFISEMRVIVLPLTPRHRT